jgi:hypothetical protein
METVNELELKVARDYATKADLGRVEGKLDSVDKRVASQESTLALVEYKLNGILGALNKIVWLIATPVVTGFVAGVVWLLSGGGA